VYAWIWRHLPGPVPARAVLAGAAAVAVLAVLFLVVFPALDAVLPYTDVDVGP
jgi:hypothetical protein